MLKAPCKAKAVTRRGMTKGIWEHRHGANGEDMALKKAAVLALLEKYRGRVSFAEIGRQVGLSRERVRQIVRKEGSHARKNRGQQEYACVQCGRRFTTWPSEVKAGRRFCSRECASQAQRGPRAARLTFRCEVCKRTYTRKASEVKRGTRFCSRACNGKWLCHTLPRERGRLRPLATNM